MRWLALLMLISLIGPGPALADEPMQATVLNRSAASETIQAARNQAVASLSEQLAPLEIGPGTTVAQFVRQLRIRDEFTKIVRQADQIGAPRWLDESTVQIYLELPAQRVEYGLKQLAAAYPRESPVTAWQIDRAVANWPRRTFSATGTSTAASALVELKPVTGDRWSTVSDPARRQALMSARAKAVDSVLGSIGEVVIVEKTTLAQVVENPQVDQSLREWLGSRPVTQVRFQENMEVQVELAVDPQDFCQVLKTVIERQPQANLPRPEQWDQVCRSIGEQIKPAIGRAVVPVEVMPATLGTIEVPTRAPQWVDQQIEVRGASQPAGPKLKTALAAETDARKNLRARLESLALAKSTTIGDAAHQDPQIAEALDRAIQRARVYRTEYAPDGSASVRLMLDLRDLWEELRR